MSLSCFFSSNWFEEMMHDFNEYEEQDSKRAQLVFVFFLLFVFSFSFVILDFWKKRKRNFEIIFQDLQINIRFDLDLYSIQPKSNSNIFFLILFNEILYFQSIGFPLIIFIEIITSGKINSHKIIPRKFILMIENRDLIE